MGGMMKPPEEMTGSMITPTPVSGPSRMIVSRSSRTRRSTSWASVPVPRSR
jgi:hypothetical protein